VARGARQYPAPVTESDAPRRTTLLVADDDARFRALLCSLLSEDGYEVVAEAADAEGAVEQARVHQPDAVVLDLVMPGATGLSTARDLMEQDRTRPVIVISSLFDPIVEREAATLGVWYLEKVDGVEALEHLIDDAVALSRSA
jgi:response regulator NasT